MNLSIHIPQFEGPLGLLLYLIRKEEMDIFDIDIQLITSQYLEYIKKMKQFDLEVAGDFIAMAATLIQIKSKMLLPNYNEEGEEEETDDPRKELVQRLIEYQRFQEASKLLYERPLLGRDVYRRGKGRNFHSDEEGEIILDEGGLFALIAHYRNSVRKMKKAIHKVAKKTLSIAGRIMEIKEKFVVGQRILLRDLLNNVEEAKEELLITFLSCLEMGKMGLVSVYQTEVYGDIYLTAKREITSDVVGRVEEYDSATSEATADRLMEEAQEEAFEMAESIENQETQNANENEQDEEDSQGIASDEEITAAEAELSLQGEAVDDQSQPQESMEEVALEAERNLSDIQNPVPLTSEDSTESFEENVSFEEAIPQSFTGDDSASQEPAKQEVELNDDNLEPLVVEEDFHMRDDNGDKGIDS